MAHGNEAVKIVYKTKLTSTETNQNFADNKNVATLKYSNDPTNEQSVKIVKDKTYHYTFSIDGNIDGTWEESGSTIDGKQGKHQTHELNKVTETYRIYYLGRKRMTKHIHLQSILQRLWQVLSSDSIVMKMLRQRLQKQLLLIRAS